MDIEEDIKKVKELNNLLKFFKKHGWIPDLSRNININGTIEAINHILAEREADKKKIKELEVLEDDLKDKRIVYVDTPEFEEKFIPKQKIKDLLTEIQEEYNEVQEQFDCIWNKKSKDDYDRYKLQEFSTMQQQLGFFIGKLEELLEEK